MADLTEIELNDGTVVKLGCNPSDPEKLKSFPVYGDTQTTPMVKRTDWKPINLDKFISPIKNQRQYGSCNAHATVYITEACRRVQGLEDVTLSPGYLYGNINGGVDRGSILEDAMQWMMNVGTVPTSMVAETDWHSRPPGAKEEAKKYKVTEVWLCPTFDHVASAIQCGFFINVGIMWFGNDNPDSDGWIPSRGFGGAGGHAIARSSLEYRNGVWGLGGPNSWGESWGKKGYFVIPETRFDNRISGYFAVRQVVDTGNVIPNG